MSEGDRNWMSEVWAMRARARRDPVFTRLVRAAQSDLLNRAPAMRTPEQVDRALQILREGQVHSGRTDISENKNRELYGKK